MPIIKYMPILSNFFLDGAKIIFGSLVIGAFVPNLAIQSPQWITIGMGIILTTAFLAVAKVSSKS